MRKIFTLLFGIISFAVNAQFSIQPQIGLENSRTTIRSNEFACFAPLGLHFAPQLGIRMNYKLKTGHGAFLGVSTSSQAVEFKFTDGQTARTNYTATGKELQLRLEAGYQFTSKPIALGKSGTANSSGKRYDGGKSNFSANHHGCGQRSFASHCSRNNNVPRGTNKGLYMRITPSAGLAFVPSGDNGIETETKAGQTTYEYKAGWNTAFITGAAFEFGSRRQSKFVISLNYLKSLGGNEETISTIANGKATTTTFRSNASSFTVSLGIPLSFKKYKAEPQRAQFKRPDYRSRCGQYRMCNH